jgi:hypothetical protein
MARKCGNPVDIWKIDEATIFLSCFAVWCERHLGGPHLRTMT